MDASQIPTPAVCTAMRTSLRPGCGTGRVWSVRTAGGPNRSTAAALIEVGIVGFRGFVAVLVAINIRPQFTRQISAEFYFA